MVEAENFTNTGLSKITAWAKNYKIEFNDDKSTAMLVPRRKRNKRNKCIFELQTSETSDSNKIPGNNCG